MASPLLGVNTWVWTSPLTDEVLPGLLRRIADLGFDAVELPLEAPHDLDHEATAAVLAETGLTPYVVGAMAPGRDLVAASPDTVAATQDYLRACVDGALAMAGAAVADVDFWVFNTPNAWYADFCGRVLGVGPERFHSVYPRYGNVGAALMPATLYHALHEGRVRPGQLVACYSVGSTSTASALVMRVGSIALGPYPTRPSDEAAAISAAPAEP